MAGSIGTVERNVETLGISAEKFVSISKAQRYRVCRPHEGGFVDCDRRKIATRRLAVICGADGQTCLRSDPRARSGQKPMNMASPLAIELESIALCFEGIIPSSICTCSSDGAPNITNLSVVHRIDAAPSACPTSSSTRRVRTSGRTRWPRLSWFRQPTCVNPGWTCSTNEPKPKVGSSRR